MGSDFYFAWLVIWWIAWTGIRKTITNVVKAEVFELAVAPLQTLDHPLN